MFPSNYVKPVASAADGPTAAGAAAASGAAAADESSTVVLNSGTRQQARVSLSGVVAHNMRVTQAPGATHFRLAADTSKGRIAADKSERDVRQLLEQLSGLFPDVAKRAFVGAMSAATPLSAEEVQAMLDAVLHNSAISMLVVAWLEPGGSAQASLPDPRRICCVARAIADWEPQDASELRLREGDTLFVTERCSSGWWDGHAADGRCGQFPMTYVEMVSESSGALAPRGCERARLPADLRVLASALHARRAHCDLCFRDAHFSCSIRSLCIA